VLKGLLQYQTEEVNLVNARMVAEERGIKVSESKTPKSEPYASLLKVTVVTENGESSVAGTVFGGAPRIVQIDAFPIVAELSGGILMLRNQDVPGVIGRIGTFLGEKGINIAGLRLGRTEVGGTAISLINVDNAVPENVLAQLRKLPNIMDAQYLVF
jgi:D-3-phosphoglycerate dehydrogenase